MLGPLRAFCGFRRSSSERPRHSRCSVIGPPRCEAVKGLGWLDGPRRAEPGDAGLPGLALLGRAGDTERPRAEPGLAGLPGRALAGRSGPGLPALPGPGLAACGLALCGLAGPFEPGCGGVLPELL
eukprot:6209863-Pleurochrysis_carterae.AAC.4